MATVVTNSEKVETTTVDPASASLATNKISSLVTTTDTANISSDVAHKIANLPNLAPDWTNRRRLIFMSMYFVGGVLALLAAVVCLGLLMGFFRASKSPVDNGLISLAETLVYSFTFFASGVIGTYCFGASYETNAYRRNMTSMVTSIATSGSDPNQNSNNNSEGKSTP